MMRERVKEVKPDGEPMRGWTAKIANLLNLSASLERGTTIKGKVEVPLTRPMIRRRSALAARLNCQLRRLRIEIFPEGTFGDESPYK